MNALIFTCPHSGQEFSIIMGGALALGKTLPAVPCTSGALGGLISDVVLVLGILEIMLMHKGRRKGECMYMLM